MHFAAYLTIVVAGIAFFATRKKQGKGYNDKGKEDVFHTGPK